MTQTPAGWYPDHTPPPPGEPPRLRYWDGLNWTGHVAPAVAPPVAPAATVATTPDGEPLAGWWIRVLAYLVDGFIYGLLANLVTIPLQVRLQEGIMLTFERLELQRGTETGFYEIFQPLIPLYLDLTFWLAIASAGIGAIYYAVMLRTKGATLGMIACGLRVRLRDQPGSLPWSAILARVAVHFLIPGLIIAAGLAAGSLVLAAVALAVNAIFVYLDALWATWDGKKQTIHDKAAKTNVVRTR